MGVIAEILNLIVPTCVCETQHAEENNASTEWDREEEQRFELRAGDVRSDIIQRGVRIE